MVALYSTRAGGVFGSGRDAQDEELACLYSELEKARLRIEEVAAYYRGELEAVRQRAEDEAIRIQAAEVSRRKRAEEQVVYLKAEYKAARAEAEHALRRHHELQQSLGELEQQNEEQARAEVDRRREAANAAWKTTEEEVERLERELHDLRRQLEREREEHRQFECSHQQQEKTNQLAEQERRRLISRLKRALKLSEDRRQRAEAGQSSLRPEGPASPWSPASLADTTNEVDSAAGWGNPPLAISGDMADEFLGAAEDRSLDVHYPESGLPDPAPGPDRVSDSEAEVLIMELDVAEKVEQRHAKSMTRPRSYSEYSTVVRTSSRGSSSELTWKWFALIGVVASFAVAAAILLF